MFFRYQRKSSSRLEIDYSDTDLYSDEGGPSPAMSHYGSSPGPSVSVSYSHAPSGATASAYMDPNLPQFHYSIPQTSTSHPHGPAYTSTHLGVPGTAGQHYGAGGGITRNSAQAYKDAFKHAITQAALLVDMGQLDDAETALEDAKRSVQWMKHYSMSG